MIQSTKQSKASPTSAVQSWQDVSRARKTIAPSHDDIAKRAYEIYVKKGCQPGQCAENWRQAEEHLRSQAIASKTTLG